MPSVDTAMGTVTVPIWAAGAVCAIFVVALVLAIKRAGGGVLITALFRVGIVAVAAYGGWIYLQRAASQDQAAERRSLDERSAALMARAIAPGSALSCLDELAGETVESACQKGVFASPEAVAAAVSYVTAKLALLTDGTAHVQQIDAAFAADLVPRRAALELDRVGIVAHVLSRREGCTVEKCDALLGFKDSSHVLANLRDHTFEDEVMKYTAIWNAPKPEGATIAAVAPTSPLPAHLTPAPAPVSPPLRLPVGPVDPAGQHPGDRAVGTARCRVESGRGKRGAHAGSAAPAAAGARRAGRSAAPGRRPVSARTGAPAGQRRSADRRRRTARKRTSAALNLRPHCGAAPKGCGLDVLLGPDCQPRRDCGAHRAHRQAARDAHDRGVFRDRCRRAPCAGVR